MLTLEDFSESQTEAIDYLYEHDEKLFIAPKGFGKCAIGFTAVNDLLRDKVLKRVLILAPSQVCNQVWSQEADKWEHIPTDNFVNLSGCGMAKRVKMMAENTPIVICNFENLAWLMTEYPKHDFDGLLVDEITKLKAVGSSAFKSIRHKLKLFKWRIGMTADPVAQESIDIYTQMQIIDLGARLGRNQENFRRKYFMPMDYMGYKWGFQPGGLERLTEVLADAIYRVESTDYEDSLPELVENGLSVELPKDVRVLYNRIIKDGIVDIDGLIVESPNRAVLQGKLLQMCCGGIYQQGEFDEHRTEIALHDVKMIALDKLLKAYNEPFLVVYQFNFQRDALVEKYGFPIFSTANGKEANNKLLKQWENGELSGMLIHPKSASHGLNLQYGPCHRLVSLGYLWSADMWDQIIHRLRRRGQKANAVYRYTIYCRNTVEDCVMKPNLLNKQESSIRFDDYIKNIKGK